MSDSSCNDSLNDMKKAHFDMSYRHVKHEDIFQDISSEPPCIESEKQQKQMIFEQQVSSTENFTNNLHKRSKSADDFHLKACLQKKLVQKVSDINNKALYPDLMGPHPLYALGCNRNLKRSTSLVDLRQKLQQCVSRWILSRKNSQKNKNSHKLRHKYPNNRTGTKYNKYSLQFKLNTINTIKQQISQSANPQKSLRYYITSQASKLKIHPKNITRWFQTKDLQNSEGGRKAKYPLLEYKLSRFIRQNPACKRKQIVEEARRLLGKTGEDADFNFSKGWYERFRARIKQEKVQRSVRDVGEGCLGGKQGDVKMESLGELVVGDSRVLLAGVSQEDVKPFKIVKIRRRVSDETQSNPRDISCSQLSQHLK